MSAPFTMKYGTGILYVRARFKIKAEGVTYWARKGANNLDNFFHRSSVEYSVTTSQKKAPARKAKARSNWEVTSVTNLLSHACCHESMTNDAGGRRDPRQQTIVRAPEKMPRRGTGRGWSNGKSLVQV
jgi:hypothetical protein